MNPKDTIHILLGRGRKGSEPLDPEGWKRVAARAAWVRETEAAWAEAQRAMTERCCEAVELLSEEAFERLCDAEQAKVDSFRVPLKDAAERDRWPRHLYFGCI
jgi:hypothetical protein